MNVSMKYRQFTLDLLELNTIIMKYDALIKE